MTNGFNSEIAKCTGCSVKDADITFSGLRHAVRFFRKVSSALLAAGDVDAVHAGVLEVSWRRRRRSAH